MSFGIERVNNTNKIMYHYVVHYDMLFFVYEERAKNHMKLLLLKNFYQ